MDINDELKNDICGVAREKTNAAGKKYLSLALDDAGNLVIKHKKNLRDVEIIALQENIIPERYQRNIGTLGIEGQKKLLLSCVAVIGLGGLGGLAAQLFARMGIGRLIIVDGDSFAESNLNRQIFSKESNLDNHKTAVALQEIKEINDGVEVITFNCFADGANLPEIIKEADIAVDCLDNLKTRFALQDTCRQKGIPMIHGAVAGYIGQISVILPGEDLLNSIYGSMIQESNGSVENDRGIETEMGNPAATPALVASWQVSETVKLLTEKDGVLSRELLYIDMLYNEIQRIPLKD